MREPQHLSRLLASAGFPVPADLQDVDVKCLRLDSRIVRPGDCFVALLGNKLDGRSFLDEAVRRGAAAILVEGPENSELRKSIGVPMVFHEELRKQVGTLFDAWHGFPSLQLESIGVTGTNGKSTTTVLITDMLRAAKRRVISLGTIRYELEDEVLGSQLTTPSPEIFFDLLDRGVRKGCDTLVMEVSSHALSQDRIRGVRFKRAVFTNLTQDHFDFHSGFEDYFAAKKKLFTEYLTEDGMAVINLDSPFGLRLAGEYKGSRITFSRGETSKESTSGMVADVVLRHQELSLSGTRMIVAYQGREFEMRSSLIGSLNVENLLAAAACGLSLGLSPEIVAEGISGTTVPGRNEVFPLGNGSFAVVDYAHTPDALERALQSLRPLTTGRLWCVFGCGGDRDRSKRAMMGRIAENLADRVVLTNDNPRNENPSDILSEILGGMMHPERVEVIEDRSLALRNSLDAMEPGDCLLVAGKGHENYQISGSIRRHFSDQEEIKDWKKNGVRAWS